VESLAEGILSLWQDQARAEELGRRGALGVREHHGVALMAQRTVETYSKLQRQAVATR